MRCAGCGQPRLFRRRKIETAHADCRPFRAPVPSYSGRSGVESVRPATRCATVPLSCRPHARHEDRNEGQNAQYCPSLG
jgi:hypothetical protein